MGFEDQDCVGVYHISCFQLFREGVPPEGAVFVQLRWQPETDFGLSLVKLPSKMKSSYIAVAYLRVLSVPHLTGPLGTDFIGFAVGTNARVNNLKHA